MFTACIAASVPDIQPFLAAWPHLPAHLGAACGAVPALLMGLLSGSASVQACAAAVCLVLVLAWRRQPRTRAAGPVAAPAGAPVPVVGQRIHVEAWRGAHASILLGGTVWDVELLGGSAPLPGDFRVAAVYGCRLRVTALPG